MDKPLVSVLMVNYNREDTVKESIESVLNQTYNHIQMIVVDDGSTDRSCEIISAISDSRLELHRLKENRHICYATNIGFQKVAGTYLARIDSDDVWYPDKLEKQLEFLENNPEYRICFSWSDLIDENGKNINEEFEVMSKMFKKSFEGQADSLRYFFFQGNCLSHPSVLMETSLMREVGDFTLGYMQSHDYDYWVRIAKKTPLYVMPECLVAIRRFVRGEKAGNNSSNDLDNVIRFYNEYADIKEHFFDDMTDELFVETFQPYFRCKDSKEPLELECEKAFLLLWESTQSHALLPAGVKRFFQLFQNEQACALLEHKFHFSVKDFYHLTKNHMYYDRWLEDMTEKVESYQSQVTGLKEEIENYESRLTVMSEKMARDQAEFANMQEQRSVLETENAALKEAIETIRNSSCWKVTKPLRVVLDGLKKKN